MNRRSRRKQARRPQGGAGTGSLDQLMSRAIALHEAEKFDEAEAIYRQVLGRTQHPDVLHLLGVVLQQKGRTAEAIETLKQAISLDPGQPPYHYNLGEAYRNTGQPERAAECYRRTLELAPNTPDAHFNLGNVLFEQGQLLEAGRSYQRAHRLVPGDGELLLNYGNVLIELGDPERALDCFRKAEAALPDDPGVTVKVGAALVALGRIPEGLQAYERATDAAEGDPEMLATIGQALLEQSLPVEAADYLGRAVEATANPADLRSFYGRALQDQGKFEQAIEQYEQAIALRSDLAGAHHGLVNSRKAHADDPEIGRLERALKRSDLPVRVRSSLNFSLAKILDDLKEPDRAFAHYAEANRLRATEMPFDPDAFHAGISDYIKFCDKSFFEARRDFGSDSEIPIFIVGMPRSGTTLVEQILASHNAVFGGGERSDLRNLVMGLPLRLGGSTAFRDTLARIDARLSRQLGDLVAGILQNLAPEAARVTDKMPNNFLRLAMVALILPNARVIHCRRDPIDTCLSCYFQDFDRGQEQCFDLTHLGRYYADYERLMAHWREVLPVQMMDVQYEELTADQERVTRAMVEYCGLEWDPSCLEPHKTGRTVRTASIWQVRQPVYRTSVERWRRYESHLGPLFDALEAGRTA